MTTQERGRVIVIGVDGSKDSDKAFQLGVKHCGSKDRLHIINGLPDSAVTGDFLITGVYDKEQDKEIHQLSRNILENYSQKCLEQNKHCTFETLRYFGGANALGEKLCDRAEELKADEVIVGSRGMTTLGKFVLGSVSSAIVNQCHCTVTVARTPKEK